MPVDKAASAKTSSGGLDWVALILAIAVKLAILDRPELPLWVQTLGAVLLLVCVFKALFFGRGRAPWRENIEALAAAVIVALSFKVFFLEVSQIPSGSMQPTLMGSPESDVKDRVLVDKLCYQARDPERFEIVVFQHPNMRSLTMVKRLVGMPGEQLKVEDGDLWTRSDASQGYKILRKPESVQRSTWRKLDPDSWGIPSGALSLTAGNALVIAPKEGSFTDRYLDGYPKGVVQALLSLVNNAALARQPIVQQLAARLNAGGRHPIGDLQLEAELRADAGLRELAIRFHEGPRSYALRLPGPAASGAQAIVVEERGAGGATRELGRVAQAAPLPAGRAVELRAQTLDDQLALWIDGEPLLAVELPHEKNQQSKLELLAEGGGAQMADFRLARDIYYTSDRSPTNEFTIPAGHYVMLGDNSLDSADGREWRMLALELDEGAQAGGARTLRGNDRRGQFREWSENPIEGRAADGSAWGFFRDVWGERWSFLKQHSKEVESLPAPYVPRELIRGRAFAIFWPVRPDRGIYRLGWAR